MYVWLPGWGFYINKTSIEWYILNTSDHNFWSNEWFEVKKREVRDLCSKSFKFRDSNEISTLSSSDTNSSCCNLKFKSVIKRPKYLKYVHFKWYTYPIIKHKYGKGEIFFTRKKSCKLFHSYQRRHSFFSAAFTFQWNLFHSVVHLLSIITFMSLQSSKFAFQT